MTSAVEHWGPFDLGGQAAIVTGGAMGLGLGIARRLMAAGADVLIADIDGAAAAAAVDALNAGPRGRAVAVECDVADAAAGALVAARCLEELGRVDILVNNAGIFPLATMLDVGPEEFDRVLAVNLRGVVFTSQGVARAMIDAGTAGVIINIGSMDAFHPAFAGLCAYGASKGAVLQATRNMALELAPHGIRVVGLAPGPIATEGSAKVLSPERRAEVSAQLLARLPLGRKGTPEEIGDVAVFLSSSAAAWMTGETVVVEGGYLLS